ncbi:pyridoxal phosphate-dependent aminotransferase [Rhodovulum sulfidophilum]|uniref:MalY/PatB family protein n=1 Tax=Rhodovulum sulfidophilum TaxID=35806 RepID=UPI0019279E6C|nr:MalY/PatB family protein [Rhodovulum sulfidophilum]MBL3584977.1 pyridoxal phosphate-dependent aminotransferase [Rhodovulum sulfidophilum]
MNFDEIIDRRGTHSSKWDMMEPIYGVSPEEGLAMWVADMDFRPPACVSQALQSMVDHGIYGYFGDDAAYKAAIGWWMKSRHGWEVDPAAIFTTHGLVNATALCIEAFTAPGDGVVLFTPVYHAFARVIRAAGREVVECPLAKREGRYEMDFAAYDAQMTGREKVVILCSPHNPGGRVWTRDELQGVADFARRHDLVLISDEIHHDLVYPGQRHTVMDLVDDRIRDRLVILSATTKSFNIAGVHNGNVIIHDPALRAKFAARFAAMGMSANSFGMIMATAAYSPEGAEWIDALMGYLDGNRKLLDEGIAAIPGVSSMPLEATYLSWVDFSGTGMAADEFTRRVEKEAKIAVNHGASFGTGGESFLRFNIATPRARISEAVERLQKAFADLQ